jgi:hypothetical protein
VKLRIEIPEPCNEDWNDMTPLDKGAFCNKCSKKLYDFSSMSDDEIIKVISRDKNACGRYRRDQLNRVLTNDAPKSILSISKYLFTLPAILFAIDSFSQLTPEIASTNNLEQLSTIDSDSVIVISGLLRNSLGQPIRNGKLTLDSNKIFYSDTAGRFEINTATSTGTDTSFTIDVNYLGYSKTVHFGTSVSIVYDINIPLPIIDEATIITRDCSHFMGASIVLPPTNHVQESSKKHRWIRVKRFFKRLFSKN